MTTPTDDLPPRDPAHWTAEIFRRTAPQHLAANPVLCGDDPAGRGDHDLNRDGGPGLATAMTSDPRLAAVLVPIVGRNPLTVLLTTRPHHLSVHPGQIAFPGGKVEAQDASPLATALREANEELGLVASAVSPVGYLNGYSTVTGYQITPVVALIAPTADLVLNREEVSDAFEVPFAFLMQTNNHRIETTTYAGHTRKYYAMPYQDRYIWGATAGIIRMLQQRLFPS